MIVTLEFVDILDKAERLGEILLESEEMIAYQHAKEELENNQEAQQLISAFINIKMHYEDVQRFGRYHPDFSQIMRDVRATKREMDMNEKVAAFKVAERNIQRLLDDVSEVIAQSVSPQIMVPKDGALFTEGGCASGGCASGGSCSCQAS